MKIQNYRNSRIFGSYAEAMNFIKTDLVNDKSIVDGQEVFVRCYDNGKVITLIAAAYIDGDGNLSFSIANNNTGIISSQVEPSADFRDDYIWLQETDESTILDDGITYDLRSMQRAISELYLLVDKFRYAFENEMNCGKVTDNSTRMKLMSESEPVIPNGYEDGTIPFLLSSFSDGEIDKIETYFKANSDDTGIIKDDTWVTDISSIELSEGLNFLWVYKTIKYKNGNEVDTSPLLMASYKENKFFQGHFDYYKLSDDAVNAPNKTEVTYSKVLPQPNSEFPYIYCYVECDYVKDVDENKPQYYNNNPDVKVKHLIIKSAETEQEIKENLLNLCDNELVWCEGNNGLYIRSKGRLVKINSAIGNNDNNNNDNNNNDNIGDIMAGIITNGDYIGSIDFVSKSNKVYRMKVNDYGKMEVYTSNLDEPDPSFKSIYKPDEKMSNMFISKLYINSFYCGGDSLDINEHSLRPCSHNFVELSNLTDNDINLNGFSLQYATTEGVWQVLPLWGVIPANGTFLIRGAQCSIMEANTTVIKVKDFDMEWYVKYNDNGTEKERLIQFNSEISKFYLTYGTATSTTSPYVKSGTTYILSAGYVDYIGVNKPNGTTPSAEGNAFGKLSPNYLIKKYYSMDGVKQATMAINKRDNAKDLCYIDLTRDDIIPDVKQYTPRTSKEGKNIYYDKTKLNEMKPSTVVVSFGIQATDNTAIGGSGATRCFNWVSKGYYDEFIWCKKLNNANDILSYTIKDVDNSWTCVESYTGKDDEVINSNNNNGYHGYYDKSKDGQYYYRIKRETTGKELCTSHKVILRKLEQGTYAYVCGKKNKQGLPLEDGCSDMRTFVVRTDASVNANSGFTFVHTSDQQGFNWDEYQVWYYAAKCISERTPNNISAPHFVLNTGDATQNGNRINEWLDYFNGREPLKNLEEQYTIGNNDLCPITPYELGNGNDDKKVNPVNITYFYTFELDKDNLPLFTVGSNKYYVPSLYSFNYGKNHFLCMNSEIAVDTEVKLMGIKSSGTLYPLIKEWCARDMQNHKNKTEGWNIAYCHEMPFTILIKDVLESYYSKTSGFTGTDETERGGSRLNTNSGQKYWFSKFCQENNIRLVMGGHKHTQAVTWPLIENYGVEGKHNMQPTIQITQEDLQYFVDKNKNAATGLTEIKDDKYADGSDSILNGRKYPNTWCNSGTTKISSDFIAAAHYCEFELVEKITAPVYSMSQATGYKHTSNKELPYETIPWCRYYFPKNGSQPHGDQKMPFYTYVTIKPQEIILNVKRINNLMSFDIDDVTKSGLFNINEEGEKVKNNFDGLAIENGIAPGMNNTETNVIIKQ